MCLNIKSIIVNILIIVCINFCYGEPTLPEVRKNGDCGGIRIENLTSPNSGNNQAEIKDNKTSPNDDLIKKIPDKLIVERPRFIARIKYSNDENDNPLAIRNLLLSVEEKINIPFIKIDSEKEIKLSKEQKISIYDQLNDYKINFYEEAGKKIDQPIISGEIPLSGAKKTSVFWAPNEEIQYEADSYVILHLTGKNDFNLDDKQTLILKSYLLRGGFIFADSSSGSPEFTKGVRRLMNKMFPENPLVKLKSDHPIFSVYANLKKIRYTGKVKTDEIRLEGMQLGCRTAVFFSQDAVSCGWDGHMHGENIDYEMHYEDSVNLGINLISYALGYRELGKDLQKVKSFKTGEVYDGSGIAFAQLKFNGDWDPDTLGIQNFLEFLIKNVNAKIYPERIVVEPSKDDLFLYPYLYLTGHGKINFEDKGKQAIKIYLERGGVIIADACCGDKEFEVSFRELILSILGNAEFRWIEPKHSLYRSFFNISSLTWRDKGLKALENILLSKKGIDASLLVRENIPYLEGVKITDHLGVYFSPLDIGCSLENGSCLICKGVSNKDESGYQLLINIIIHIMMSA